jgi:hypothetical protein
MRRSQFFSSTGSKTKSAAVGAVNLEQSLIEIMTPITESTITRLNSAQFLLDPIAGSHFSRIVSVLSSAYKRHGRIIETATLHQLKTCPRFDVWTEPDFKIPADADLIAGGALKKPSSIFGNHINYGDGPRS